MITAKSYTLTTDSGAWLGQIVLTTDENIPSVTDYGNLSFAWRHYGSDDFRKFILDLDIGYFGSKMTEGLSYIYYDNKTSKACDRFAKQILPPLKKVLREELENEGLIEKQQSNMVTLYKNVFDRNDLRQITFEEFINFSEDKEIFQKIKSIEDKTARNQYKRDNLKAADFSNCDFFCVDIDNINQRERLEIINKLAKIDFVWIVKESVSGNLCVFIKYDTNLKDKFEYVYYKKYLELTLQLGINIDFLPEIGRLRYVSDGQIFFRREVPMIVNDDLDFGELPYINTNGKLTRAEGGTVSYGSGRGIEDEVSKIIE